ncbi:hypothetical protein [Streptacidiphilus sp. MAP12-33]|uniref:hypothetical protein n=1 Tax=Streptacidiphilus sp. MAP12-33 TaxID=3156266 RepID=UPI003515EB21
MTEASAASQTTLPVSMATDASTYAYGAWAKVTVRVGAAGGSATVSAQSVGDSRPVVKGGKVDAHGNLVEYFHLWKNTTFTVTGSDTGGGSGRISRTVRVRAGMAEALKGYYGSTHLGRTLYRLYHRGGQPEFDVTVLPRRQQYQQLTVRIRLQQYVRGAWRTVSDNPNSVADNGTVSQILMLIPPQQGDLFRFQGSWAGDSADAAATGGWLYLAVRY